jgi:hypothetical protein
MTNEKLNEQVMAAVRELGQGTADEIVKKVEEANPDAENKELIAATHFALTELHDGGKLKGTDREGSIVYSLQTISE